MSETEPTKPYVYQPFGMRDKAHWEAKRIYAVRIPYAECGGLANISGLTKTEADRVCAALNAVSPQAQGQQNEGAES